MANLVKTLLYIVIILSSLLLALVTVNKPKTPAKPMIIKIGWSIILLILAFIVQNSLAKTVYVVVSFVQLFFVFLFQFDLLNATISIYLIICYLFIATWCTLTIFASKKRQKTVSRSEERKDTLTHVWESETSEEERQLGLKRMKFEKPSHNKPKKPQIMFEEETDATADYLKYLEKVIKPDLFLAEQIVSHWARTSEAGFSQNDMQSIKRAFDEWFLTFFTEKMKTELLAICTNKTPVSDERKWQWYGRRQEIPSHLRWKNYVKAPIAYKRIIDLKLYILLTDDGRNLIDYFRNGDLLDRWAKIPEQIKIVWNEAQNFRLLPIHQMHKDAQHKLDAHKGFETIPAVLGFTNLIKQILQQIILDLQRVEFDTYSDYYDNLDEKPWSLRNYWSDWRGYEMKETEELTSPLTQRGLVKDEQYRRDIKITWDAEKVTKIIKNIWYRGWDQSLLPFAQILITNPHFYGLSTQIGQFTDDELDYAQGVQTTFDRAEHLMIQTYLEKYEMPENARQAPYEIVTQIRKFLPRYHTIGDEVVQGPDGNLLISRSMYLHGEPQDEEEKEI